MRDSDSGVGTGGAGEQLPLRAPGAVGSAPSGPRPGPVWEKAFYVDRGVPKSYQIIIIV